MQATYNIDYDPTLLLLDFTHFFLLTARSMESVVERAGSEERRVFWYEARDLCEVMVTGLGEVGSLE